jgi:hypothetical protein
MKFFNIARKYVYKEEVDNDGDKGSSDSNENNKEDKPDDFSNVWHTNTDDANNNGQQQVQKVEITNQQPVQEVSRQDRLAAHIGTLGLADGLNMEALQNPETALKEMERIQALTYSAAMKDTNTLIQQAVSQVKDELTAQTQETLSGNSAINNLNTALPYTKEAAYAPVANSLLTQFMSKGQTQEQAVVNVGKYFAKMAEDVNKTLPKSPNNRMNGNNFNNLNVDQTEGADTEDWIKILSAT